MNFEDLNQLEYTTAVIKETLRRWPVVATAIPRVALKDLNIGGYSVPKDTRIMCMQICRSLRCKLTHFFKKIYNSIIITILRLI